MEDNFALVDIAAYSLGVALILPAIVAFERNSPEQLVLLFILLAPLPFHVVRLRGYSFPDSFDAVIEKQAYVTLFVGLLVVVGLVGYWALRWLI
jgi:hypothetical protein